MKRVFIALFALALTGLARADGLSGWWSAPGANGELRMRVQTSDTNFGATIEVPGGSPIRLLGTVDGNRARGTAQSAEGAGRFEAVMTAPQRLQLTLSQGDGPNQRAASVRLDFSRVGAAPSAQAGAAGAGGDPRVVGDWVFDDVILSGSASFASQEMLSIGADGSYALWRGRAAGSGSNWSFSGGSDGQVERGRWRAQGGVLFVADASGQWARVGTYGLTEDGRTMRIVYDGGGRRIWKRR